MADTGERNKAVEQAISQIERQFGRGFIMKMNDSGYFISQSIQSVQLRLQTHP